MPQDPLDANVEAKLNTLERLLQTLGMGMHDPPQRLAVRFDDIDEISMRRSGVQEERQVEARGQLELRGKVA